MPSRSASPWKLTSRRRWLRSRFGSIGAGLSSVAILVTPLRDVSQVASAPRLSSGQPELSRVRSALTLVCHLDDVPRAHLERLDDQVVEAPSWLAARPAPAVLMPTRRASQSTRAP